MINFLVIFFYTLIAYFVFGKLPLAFFQQDEWVIFGTSLYWDKASIPFIDRLFIYQQATHLVPLSRLFPYLQFKIFALNFAPYAITSIVFHLINTLLVYTLCLILTKRRGVSFLAGLLFLVNSTTSQAVTWVATIGTVWSTTFVLLSLIYFANKKLLISFLLFIVSLAFKETPSFLLIFFPIFWVVVAKDNFFKVPKIVIYVFLLACFYLLIRVLFVIFGQPIISSSRELSQPPLLVFGYRILTNPIKILSQSILPETVNIQAARLIVSSGYPQFVVDGSPNPFIVESIAVDIVSFLSFIMISLLSCFSFLYFRKTKRPLLIKGMLLSISYVLLSPLPLIFIPGHAGYFSLVDGRHLYITSIFSSILLSLIFFSFFHKARRILSVLYIIACIPILILVFHGDIIRRGIENQISIGKARTSILNWISRKHPTLPDKVIFFVASDQAYYGLGETTLPFQSGFGQTLLIWYEEQGQTFPSCIYEKQFLYEQLSEGYRECNGKGFGYFRTMDALRGAISQYGFPVEHIIAYSYISSTNSLIDISESIRKQL